MAMQRMTPCQVQQMTSLGPWRGSRRSIALAILTVMLVVPDKLALAANTPDGTELARQVLADPGYQTSLPGSDSADGLPPAMSKSGQDAAPGKPSPPAHQDQPGDQSSTTDTAPPDLPAAPSNAASALTVSVLRALPLLLLGVGVLAVLYFAINAFLQRRRVVTPLDAASPPPVVASDEPSAAVPVPLPEWQVLANQGRYSDAIHLLLLQLLIQLRRERLIQLTQSRTSREILRTGDLPPERKSGLATLIGAVEFCHFGGRPAGALLFENCLAAYHQAILPVSRHAALD